LAASFVGTHPGQHLNAEVHLREVPQPGGAAEDAEVGAAPTSALPYRRRAAPARLLRRLGGSSDRRPPHGARPQLRFCYLSFFCQRLRLLLLLLLLLLAERPRPPSPREIVAFFAVEDAVARFTTKRGDMAGESRLPQSNVCSARPAWPVSRCNTQKR
jgi:hypothetical protein